jgi:hypothetical protein
MSPKIAKTLVMAAEKQITGIRITPILKEAMSKSKTKLVVHTYSGEYFDFNKKEKKGRDNIQEYQIYY